MADWQVDIPKWQHFHIRFRDLLGAMLSDKSPCMHSIQSRVKTIESIRAKLTILGSNDVSDIPDIIGFRIVVPALKNIQESLIDHVLHSLEDDNS